MRIIISVIKLSVYSCLMAFSFSTLLWGWIPPDVNPVELPRDNRDNYKSEFQKAVVEENYEKLERLEITPNMLSGLKYVNDDHTNPQKMISYLLDCDPDVQQHADDVVSALKNWDSNFIQNTQTLFCHSWLSTEQKNEGTRRIFTFLCVSKKNILVSLLPKEILIKICSFFAECFWLKNSAQLNPYRDQIIVQEVNRRLKQIKELLNTPVINSYCQDRYSKYLQWDSMKNNSNAIGMAQSCEVRAIHLDSQIVQEIWKDAVCKQVEVEWKETKKQEAITKKRKLKDVQQEATQSPSPSSNSFHTFNFEHYSDYPPSYRGPIHRPTASDREKPSPRGLRWPGDVP